MSILPTGSKSFQARNPHLFGGPPTSISTDHAPGEAVKRMRQSSKPLLNGLETSFLSHLCSEEYLPSEVYSQAITLRLANGLRYTPDFFIFRDQTAWEVKGKWVDGDSFPKLKMAASVFLHISFRLVWKVDGVWHEQVILP
jgi:hypothetical protein